MDFGPKHRKRIWFTAAVGGLASVTGLAAVSIVASVASPGLRSDLPSASGRQVAAQSAGGDDKDAKKSKDGKSDSYGMAYDRYVDVPCDPDELIQAILTANAEGGGALKLAEHCTYTLTRTQGGGGLPPITQRVTIKGNGASIVRSAGASIPQFRIFEVAVGGDLSLQDLSVKYGIGTNTSSGPGIGGGGLLVQPGGMANVENSTFAYNWSTSVGGAIANFGITKVTGDGGRDMRDGGLYEPKGKDGASQWGKDAASEWGKDGASQGGKDQWGKEPDGVWRSDLNNNFAQGIGSAPSVVGGGAIFSNRFLTVENTRLSYNSAVGNADGGAIATTDGGVTILRSILVDHNRAGDDGGGVYSIDGATTTLERSYVSDNVSGGAGAGINNQTTTAMPPAMHLLSTIVRHNSSGDSGGGINNSGKLVVDNSRINENTTSEDGGGLYNTSTSAQTVLRHTEVDLNKAIGTSSQAGGIDNVSGTLSLLATSVAENLSVNEPGGIRTNNSNVDVDDESEIIRNRPTNCLGSVPNCFG